MSVRVVARIRPLLKSEREADQILTEHAGADDKTSIVKIPNPKNFAEEYSFQFNSVYGQDSTQQQIFEAEVSPTIKQLFQGCDVTIFAYGSTGTGKTHTMRGGKSLADRGMIPRLLSNIYRKSKTIEKNSNGETTVQVSMSYYEIYNDRVFDLFEAPEKRNATGLPIREAEGRQTVVVGLTEEPCNTLKEFEVLYDKANANRSTGATKLNAHSSRSHAILCVKVTITSPTETRVSTASAIDLAGSEDNRRTGNGKDRMVESASINKSLFVLAQCVEAISKKHSRIPYRESKMTRILSLGQNNGVTVMILNLAPTKSFHLDTLSSLNFANRTKKIEVREVENEPIFKGPPRLPAGGSISGATLQRQPLRPLSHIVNIDLHAQRDAKDKPAKAFAVYSDRNKPIRPSNGMQKSSPLKRNADSSLTSTRPLKQHRSAIPPTRLTTKQHNSISTADLEALVERKVSSLLATHTLAAPAATPPTISAGVQARLDSIEARLEGAADGERAEGLSYIFMGKQHQARGEHNSALRMYELAKTHFPDNAKLAAKIERLKQRIAQDKQQARRRFDDKDTTTTSRPRSRGKGHHHHDEEDESYIEDPQSNSPSSPSDDNASPDRRPKPKRNKPPQKRRPRTSSPDPLAPSPPTHGSELTPRTRHLLSVINSRDVERIKTLAGVGPKRAVGWVEYLGAQEREEDVGGVDALDGEVRDWKGLCQLPGLGERGVLRMREGVVL